MSSIQVKFPTDDAAVSALESAGFSVGQKQRSEPRGILYGGYLISKWRNLTAQHWDLLDGTLCRHGPQGSPCTVTLHSAGHIPAKAILAVQEASA